VGLKAFFLALLLLLLLLWPVLLSLEWLEKKKKNKQTLFNSFKTNMTALTRKIVEHCDQVGLLKKNKKKWRT
jgi:sulfatase maturation enzyme AslB (radical SAM superfamily)